MPGSNFRRSFQVVFVRRIYCGQEEGSEEESREESCEESRQEDREESRQEIDWCGWRFVAGAYTAQPRPRSRPRNACRLSLLAWENGPFWPATRRPLQKTLSCHDEKGAPGTADRAFLLSWRSNSRRMDKAPLCRESRTMRSALPFARLLSCCGPRRPQTGCCPLGRRS